MTEELKKARDRVLVDNTAQAVFKHLDRLEDNRTRLGLRWIWELLQNARDAATSPGVHVSIRLSESELCFEHDGRAFASGEIAHLVYHGSTKIEDFENVGQFGSGFLSTHLVSRTVRVSGCLEDSRGFTFLLDRTGASVDELREAMDRSWEAFERAVETDLPPNDPANTSFTYVLAEQGRLLAHEGLVHLERCAPFVLAFCPQIRGISVATTDRSWSIERDRYEPLTEGSGVQAFQCEQNGQSQSRFVALTERDADLCAALALYQTDVHLAVEQQDEPAPKLFVLFPLIGSERMPFPVSINSKLFKPREDRDGIDLQGDSPGIRENRRLLEDSARHQRLLLELCAREKWSGAEQLLAFDTSHLPDWADAEAEWCRGLLNTLVCTARSTQLMLTGAGDWIAPKAAWVPTTDDETHSIRLWELMSAWKGASARLPKRDHLSAWSRNLSSWARLADRPASEMDEALTLHRVARLVSEAGSLDALKERLTDDHSLRWLVSLLCLVQEAGRTRLFDEHGLLPSQVGALRKRSELRRDDGISEDLKDIAEAFDISIRSELLHSDAEVDGIAGLLTPVCESDLLDQLLTRVNHECQDGMIDSSLAPGVVELFSWIVDREQYLDRLDGLPMPTMEVVGDKAHVLPLKRDAEAQHRPLAPVSIWPEEARPFATLFPKRKILAAALHVDDDSARWVTLAEQDYVNVSPLIMTRRKMEAFLPDEPLPENDGTESHKTTQEVEVSDIVFLTEDRGPIDTARKSKTRATDFIRFLVDFTVATDDRAFEQLTVDCECGQGHELYRAAWLVPLHRRRWVPLESDGRRAARASAESLARLLSDSPSVADLLSGDCGEKLLMALGISPADLALRVVADDEETRVALIRSMSDLADAAGGADKVRALVDLIQDDPGILKTIEERKQNRERVRRNQSIGRLVEELLREQLEERGLKVERTGTGSDYEVESDFIENEQEIMLELGIERNSTLVEVKSARTDRVKMTPMQVRTACEKGSQFALCVVRVTDDNPTGDTIREHSRFVFGVGDELAEAWTAYRGIKTATDVALQTHGDVELEIHGQEVRFSVGSQIWSRGLCFADAVSEFLKRGGITGACAG